MDKHRLETFKEQWHGIHDIVISETKRQIKIFGKVNVQQLTQKLQEEIAKWPQGVLSQGVWFQEFHTESPNEALEFMTEAMSLVIQEPKHSQLPSANWVYCVTLFFALLVGVILHGYTALSIIEQCFYPLLSLVVLNTICMPLKNRLISKAEDAIVNDIEEQINEMGHALERHIDEKVMV